MKKAFSLSFFIIGLIALASVAITKTQSQQQKDFDTGAFEYPLLSHHMDEAEQARRYKGTSSSEQSSVRAKDVDLKATFLDRTRPLEARLDAWIELHESPSIPFKSLVEIALSPNPYDDESIEGNAVLLRDFQREESFRIMALQSLERAILENDDSIVLIEQIAREASSPTVRSIAQKMCDFSRKGRSYTSLFEQAVMDLEIPR